MTPKKIDGAVGVMSETILRTLELTKRYKNRLAVDHLNIEVRRGHIFGFLGPNGAGKSTTIRMILNLIFPTEGDVELFGRSLTQARHKALARVGSIVEKPSFYGHLSALRNLEILGGMERPVPHRTILTHLKRVGLADRAGDKVKTFSQGMNQRLGLALALLNDPELIILDEPTTGLDPQGMKEVRDLIRELSQERGITVFLSSHLLYEIEMIADHMAVIHQGKLRVAGSVRDLLVQGDAAVLVKTDRPAEASQMLKTKGGYEAVEMQADGINVKLALADIPALNRLLVREGFAVYTLTPRRTLEQYFLNLIEGHGP
jgi:ABC-2 type transport system ATP-binding protein